MDTVLKQLVDLASGRGSRYVKGEVSVEELPHKVAELGAYLLSRVNNLSNHKGERLREEINDIQNKIDDMRKVLFASKAKVPN